MPIIKEPPENNGQLLYYRMKECSIDLHQRNAHHPSAVFFCYFPDTASQNFTFCLRAGLMSVLDDQSAVFAGNPAQLFEKRIRIGNHVEHIERIDAVCGAVGERD